MLEAAWVKHGAFVHCQIIWVKNKGVPTRTWYLWQHEPCLMGWLRGNMPARTDERRLSTVWQIDTIPNGSDRPNHPTPKPLETFEIPIRQHTVPGEICYEPFSGSGTQFIAAERLQRRCFGIEISPTYCDVIIRRYIAFAGESAVAPEIADPDNCIAFTRNDERGIAPVAAACKKDADSLHKPRSPLNRNAFLCGCIEATHGHGLEHLIVGFGRKHGKTTKVDQIAHNRGTSDTVSIPPHIRSAMINHVQGGFANEVILFHNHPPSWINAVFDNQPLPSLTDRATLTDYHSQPVILLKLLFGGGRVRFYLGENGYVREFRTPHIRVVMGHLRRLGLVRDGVAS